MTSPGAGACRPATRAWQPTILTGGACRAVLGLLRSKGSGMGSCGGLHTFSPGGPSVATLLPSAPLPLCYQDPPQSHHNDEPAPVVTGLAAPLQTVPVGSAAVEFGATHVPELEFVPSVNSVNEVSKLASQIAALNQKQHTRHVLMFPDADAPGSQLTPVAAARAWSSVESTALYYGLRLSSPAVSSLEWLDSFFKVHAWQAREGAWRWWRQEEEGRGLPKEGGVLCTAREVVE